MSERVRGASDKGAERGSNESVAWAKRRVTKKAGRRVVKEERNNDDEEARNDDEWKKASVRGRREDLRDQRGTLERESSRSGACKTMRERARRGSESLMARKRNQRAKMITETRQRVKRTESEGGTESEGRQRERKRERERERKESDMVSACWQQVSIVPTQSLQ